MFDPNRNRVNGKAVEVVVEVCRMVNRLGNGSIEMSGIESCVWLRISRVSEVNRR